MNDELLKGNFSVKKKIKSEEIVNDEEVASKFKKAALSSIGGSMVYVEKTDLSWDGESEKSKEKKNSKVERDTESDT